MRTKGDSFALSMVDGGRVTHHLITPNKQGGFDVNSKQLPTPCTSLEAVITLLSRTPVETVPALLSNPLPPDTEA